MGKYSIILGFFDGVHAGHREVIRTTVDYAEKYGLTPVLLRPEPGPYEFFGRDFEYILSKKRNYELIQSLGVKEIYPIYLKDFAAVSAEDFLAEIVKKYSPAAITTGFNHTFGAKKQGNAEFLNKNQEQYNFKYFCVEPCFKDGDIVSSTRIRNLLSNGKVKEANRLLESSFCLEGVVIKGDCLGRELGFPTANLIYPEKIVKIPYGVYKVKTNNKPAILNWGKRPTVNGKQEILEVHIPNYSGNLYNSTLQVEVLEKIRNEKKFNSLEDLKQQIAKDVEVCLKS